LTDQCTLCRHCTSRIAREGEDKGLFVVSCNVSEKPCVYAYNVYNLVSPGPEKHIQDCNLSEYATIY
jgi:hypothetical protein